MPAATAPVYAATPNVDGGLVPATFDTSLTAPTNVTTVFTAGANGSMVYEIRSIGVGTTAAGVVNVFRKRSATYYLIDQVLVAVVPSSTTAIAFRDVRKYQDVFLKSGDTLCVTTTVAGNQSMLEVTVHGGDF